MLNDKFQANPTEFLLSDSYLNSPNGSVGWRYVYPEIDSLKPLSGFNYCKVLELSIFDISVFLRADVVVRILGDGVNVSDFVSMDKSGVKWIHAKNLNVSLLTSIVDKIAETYFDEVQDFYTDVEEEDLLLASCFHAADGNK